jgi:hypothetical protein
MPYTAPLKTLLSAQHIEYTQPAEVPSEPLMFFNHNEVPEVALPSAIIESRVYRGKGQRVARGAPLKTLLSAQHIEYTQPAEVPSERPGLARSVSARVQNKKGMKGR